MKNWLLIGLLVGSTPLLPACAPKSYTTAVGKAAYSADQVVLRLGEFQNAVISGADSQQISATDARAIIVWISGDGKVPGAVDILNATPTGWRSTVTTSWAVIKPKVVANAYVAPWVPLIDALLGGVQ